MPAFIGGAKQFPSLTTSDHGKYLWGIQPAIDVLNLDKNEGSDVRQDIRLLFAGKLG